MRKLVLFAIVMSMAIGLLTSPVQAMPPFNKEFLKLYVEPAKDAPLAKAIEKVKCNVCHEGTAKKNKNEYGIAVGKLLKKTEFGPDKISADPEGKAKEIVEALKKVEAEKSKDGKTFGEKMKAGSLPAAT
jgi:hypothetical protein